MKWSVFERSGMHTWKVGRRSCTFCPAEGRFFVRLCDANDNEVFSFFVCPEHKPHQRFLRSLRVETKNYHWHARLKNGRRPCHVCGQESTLSTAALDKNDRAWVIFWHCAEHGPQITLQPDPPSLA